MKTPLKICICLAALVATVAHAFVKDSGWTSTTNAHDARIALGATNDYASWTNAADGMVRSNQALRLDNFIGNSQDPLTPRKGFMSWYSYGENRTDENMFTNAVLTMKTNGLWAHGYNWICLDDGWSSTNLLNGLPTWSTNKWWNIGGLSNAISFAHSNGFFVQIYVSDVGSTCAGYPGMSGKFDACAALFNSWGVDGFKMESCPGVLSGSFQRPTVEYWLQALYRVNPNKRWYLDFSTMETGFNPWMSALVISQRGCGDWLSTYDGSMWTNIIWHSEFVDRSAYGSKPAFANDQDAIDLTDITNSAPLLRTMFGLQCLQNSPLMLDSFDASRWDITDPGNHFYYWMNAITNRYALKVHDDPLSLQARKVWKSGHLISVDMGGPSAGEPWGWVGTRYFTNDDAYVLSRQLVTGERGVGLVNFQGKTTNITFTSAMLNIPDVFTVFDVWSETVIAWATNSYTQTVPVHDLGFDIVIPGIVTQLTPGTNWLGSQTVKPRYTWTNWWSGAGTERLYKWSTNNEQVCLGNGGCYTNWFEVHPAADFDFFCGGAERFHFEPFWQYQTTSNLAVEIKVSVDGTVVLDQHFTNTNPNLSISTTNDLAISGQKLNIHVTFDGTPDLGDAGRLDLGNPYLYAPQHLTNVVLEGATTMNGPVTFNGSVTTTTDSFLASKVGIGTTTLVEPLTVQGDAIFGVPGNNQIHIRDNSIENYSGDSDSMPVNVNYAGYNGGTSRHRNFQVFDGTGNRIFYVEGSTSNFWFQGNLCLATNAKTIWPVSAPSSGACAFVNSNGTLFVLISSPGSTAWTSTNKIAP